MNERNENFAALPMKDSREGVIEGVGFFFFLGRMYINMARELVLCL
jgi:hypothetical protein